MRAIIKENSPFVGSSLSECKLSGKGLLVLGIERDKDWIPIPKAKETIKEGDRLVVYGHLNILRELFRRK